MKVEFNSFEKRWTFHLSSNFAYDLGDCICSMSITAGEQDTSKCYTVLSCLISFLAAILNMATSFLINLLWFIGYDFSSRIWTLFLIRIWTSFLIRILVAGFGLHFSSAQDVVFVELPQCPTVMLQVLVDKYSSNFGLFQL